MESKRGIKRKRYEPQDDLGIKIRGKLHHGSKEVRKAAKKAKIFETLKLVKRLKGLRKKGDSSEEVIGLEAQLEELRAIDYDIVANMALKTKLNKDGNLSENGLVQTAISTEIGSNLLIPAVFGTPSAKVQSRLLSSKILAAGISAVVEGLRNVIQPRHDLRGIGAKEGTDDVVREPSTKFKKDAQIQRKTGDVRLSYSDDPGSESQDVQNENIGQPSETGWESETVDGDEGEGDEDGWESGSLLGAPRGTDNDKSEESSEDRQDENEGSFNSSHDHEFAVKALTNKPKPLPSESQTKTSTTQSTFLPSLSVGFIRGSDDSDWSEGEAKLADPDQKKNRRGQRARRAIWEKKFGQNANHKRREAEQRQTFSRRKGHDLNGKAMPPPNRPRDGQKQPGRFWKQVTSNPAPQQHLQADSGWGQRVSATGTSTRTLVSQKGHKGEKPLHPSWEAKRKLKMKESGGIVPSQGKKIKFS